VTGLVTLTAEQRAVFGKKIVVASHALADNPLFSDSHLIHLLDNYPREYLFVLTMGSELEKPDENLSVAYEGFSGEELLRAVKRGRLWVNATRADLASRELRELVGELYAGLSEECPNFAADDVRATVLISSPRALVYYHMDGNPSLLWHVRGKKRVWVYPALDDRVMSRTLIEDIFASATHEYAPYSHTFDVHATELDLMPGSVASWPQNAPHRVTNLEGLNVSLSTEHWTPDAQRRARVYQANRFLRLKTGYHPRSTKERGLVSLGKVLTWKALSKLGVTAAGDKRHVHRMRLDPDAERGCVSIGASPGAE
jgi:hypothetical protein